MLRATSGLTRRDFGKATLARRAGHADRVTGVLYSLDLPPMFDEQAASPLAYG